MSEPTGDEHEPDVIYVPMCVVCHRGVHLDDEEDGGDGEWHHD